MHDEEDDAEGEALHRMYQVFQEFDHNGNGKIDAGELRKTLRSVGTEVTKKEAAGVLQEMDTICQGLVREGAAGGEEFADDGELNFEEFFSVFQSLEGHGGHSTVKSIAATVKGLLERVQLKVRWGTIDRSRRALSDVRAVSSAGLPDFQRLQLSELLGAVPLLSGLTVAAKEQLLDVVAVRKYRKGQEVVCKGDECGNTHRRLLPQAVQDIRPACHRACVHARVRVRVRVCVRVCVCVCVCVCAVATSSM